MKEKKLKQTIISIAFILLFCSYYLTPASIGRNQVENKENKVTVFSNSVENRMLQDESLPANTGLEGTKNFKFSFAMPDDFYKQCCPKEFSHFFVTGK